MHSFAIFALNSLWEGLPRVLPHAMATGLPIVATAVGGTPEVGQDGVTGTLIPPRAPDALAKAIIALLPDRERAEAMGRAGRERDVGATVPVAHFSVPCGIPYSTGRGEDGAGDGSPL